MRSVAQFLRLPLADKLVTGEAVVYLIVAWVLVRFTAFKSWTARLGTVGLETESTDLLPEHEQRFRHVKAGIERARQIAPPLRNCLVQSVAARLMLRRRHLPSTLYIAVTTNRASQRLSVSGHAWVRCGHLTIGSNKGGLQKIFCLGDAPQ